MLYKERLTEQPSEGAWVYARSHLLPGHSSFSPAVSQEQELSCIHSVPGSMRGVTGPKLPE